MPINVALCFNIQQHTQLLCYYSENLGVQKSKTHNGWGSGECHRLPIGMDSS